MSCSALVKVMLFSALALASTSSGDCSMSEDISDVLTVKVEGYHWQSSPYAASGN